MVRIEVLKKAREIISEPSAWTRGAFAQDKSRRAVNFRAENAVCFCALGALFRAADDICAIEEENFLESFIFGSRSVATFNDDPETSHNDVLAVFDRAIAHLEAAP